METIVSAAVEYVAKGTYLYCYVSGHRHRDCFKQLKEKGLPTSKRVMSVERQGFFTSEGRFVDRAEACDVALASGQYTGPRKILTSEDLW